MLVRHIQLEQLKTKTGICCTIIWVLMALIIYFRYILPRVFIDLIYELFAVYESVMAVAILIALVYLFKMFFIMRNKVIDTMCVCAFFFSLITAQLCGKMAHILKRVYRFFGKITVSTNSNL